MVLVKPADIGGVLTGRGLSAAVVLVFGPDAGLVSERSETLVRRLAGDDDDAFRLVRLDGDALAADPQRLVDEANTISLFGDKRVIHIRAGAKNIVPAVKPVLDQKPEDAVILIQAGDLSKSSPLRALCERSPAALALPCYADGPRELSSLVDEVLGEFDLRIEPEARRHLLPLLGGDRRASRNEIEKIGLYARGGAEVTVDDVYAVVGDASALAVDAYVDAVFGGALDEVESQGGRLEAEAMDAGVVLGFALRHGVALLQARIAMDNGVPASTAVERMRPHFKRRAAVERQLRIWSTAGLLRAVRNIGGAVAATRREPALRNGVARTAAWSVAMAARRAAR